MSSNNRGNASHGQGKGSGGSAQSNGGGSGGPAKSSGNSRSGGSGSGWQAGYQRAYADAINGINNGETWGFAGGSDRFGEGYMRGHQETYGDKGP